MTSLQPTCLGGIRLRCLFLLAVVFGVAFMTMSLCREPGFVSLDSELLRPAHYYQLDSDSRFTINTNGCTIPALRPFDDNIKKFIEPPRRLKKCQHMHTSLLANNATHIWINNNNLHHYNLSNDFNISCCYKAFYRPNAIADITSYHVDDRVKYHECIEFFDVIEALDEFVRVSCYDNMGEKDSLIFEDFFIYAPKKVLISDNVNNVQFTQNQSAYNVIVLGIDSVSRLNFYRTMPRTLEFLRNKGAIELFGYNKIGDNTFPNLAAMLLGVKDTELKRMCWPSPRHTFDNCPFVWDWYKENGFYTAFGEDSAYLGTFNFVRHGFAATPTDYYLHTFIREAEMHVGNIKDFNSYICMGNKYAYKVLLDYVESLTRTLRSSKLFGFFWEVTMSHDFLNNPKSMDINYENFLKKLEKSKYLDDTVIIMLSDHGIRWGNFRLTKQGRLEERLPFVHILLPPSFQTNYSLAYHNIKLNSKHLTTPFDMFATISDLANLESIRNEKISARNKQNYADNRSISLFLPIPKNRTCKTAGIDDHWCTCHKDRSLSVESDEAKDAAQFVVTHMNELLIGHLECARLSLANIVDVREMEAGTPAMDEEGWRELLVLVRTAPGGGVFEATLRRSVRGAGADTTTEDAAADWALAGSVSRLNLYGDQSRCVNSYILKLYCVCLTETVTF
ncbi:uncharacterized protein LOC134740717 [Cydia strobilella]|uniref:uncharacterized protein LOC134740717 n=1 Tax=Cydia strobilella TaxID=1100964 RepID=UPI0030077BE5